MTQHLLRIAFRVDAGIKIGTGHVIRCLTLATALKDHGAECIFICRPHEGHLLDYIAEQGFLTQALPDRPTLERIDENDAPPHASWLGTDQIADANDTHAALAKRLGSNAVDWMVVDHYALDARWETSLRSACTRLMVIDDLADRLHDCDLLLDQSLGRDAADYDLLVAPAITLLIGPQYALLRPEFPRLRAASLSRREYPKLQNILVTMGGIDKDNATGTVLDTLASCKLPDGVQITVVMGAQASWLDHVREQALAMPFPTDVRVGVHDMAALMSESDLAIGGGGMTSIERCILGLPTILVIQAQNQIKQAGELERAGAVVIYDPSIKSSEQCLGDLIANIGAPETYTAMSQAAAQITDAKGLELITTHIRAQPKSAA